jgi:hypothetical protein
MVETRRQGGYPDNTGPFPFSILVFSGTQHFDSISGRKEDDVMTGKRPLLCHDVLQSAMERLSSVKERGGDTAETTSPSVVFLSACMGGETRC